MRIRDHPIGELECFFMFLIDVAIPLQNPLEWLVDMPVVCKFSSHNGRNLGENVWINNIDCFFT